MRLILFNLLLIILFGCDKKEMEDGKNSIFRIEEEAIGINCPNGGMKIFSGLDLNMDGYLDDNEVQFSQYICNGVDGKNFLIEVNVCNDTSICDFGGYKILQGLDINNDGILDNTEIMDSIFICNGLNGNSGENSLIKIEKVLYGSDCPSGGYLIESGLDQNNNFVLDQWEIEYEEYVCNGSDYYDIETRLTILDLGQSKGTNRNSTTGYFMGNLERFNKDLWIGVDSIVFITNLETSDVLHTATVELFDLTNNKVITNSILTTNNNYPTYLETGNLYDFLPGEEIDICLRIKIENSNSNAILSGRSYLKLFR